jgi:hypothetical protein
MVREANDHRVFVSPYHILRIDEIPVRISFYQLLSKLASYSRHIIGIARTADYRAKRLGRTIYVYCTSLIDARFMEQSYIDLVGDGRDAQAPTIVDSVIGRASLTNLNDNDRFAQIPVSIHIKGLEKQQDRTGGTYYLMQIVKSYEDSATITGIRLNYDVRKSTTRNDGFVTYLHQSEAREIGGETEPKIHLEFGLEIAAMLSENVPMLVRIPDSLIFHNGACEWTEDAERMNQLIITHHVPIDSKGIKTSKQSSENHASTSSVQDIQESPTVIANLDAQEQVPSTSTTTSTSTSVTKADVIEKEPDKSATSARIVISGGRRKKQSSDKDLETLSITAVFNKKDGTTKRRYPIVYDSSDEEIHLVKSVSRRVSNWSAKAPRKQIQESSSSSSSSDEEGQLIINEDVQLDDEEEASTSRDK